MQTLILKRGIQTSISHTEAEGTPGSLDTFVTLELPDRDNRPDVSRINAGTYLCIVTHSTDLNADTYELQSVPGRSEVRIHWGNWAGDVEQKLWTDVKGCILIGQSFGRMAPGLKGTTDYESPQFCVVSSESAFTSFMQKMNGQQFQLQIVDSVIAS